MKKISIRTLSALAGILFVLCLVALGYAYFTVLPDLKQNAEIDAIIKEEEATEGDHMDAELRKMWLTNYSINSDYVGNIIFDSGIINEPVVFADDVYKDDGSLYTFYNNDGNEVTLDVEAYSGNDVYIWTDWQTGKPIDKRTGIGGSTFMDCRNYTSDDVVIIYGHHWARDYTEKNGIDPNLNFTPLDLLEDEANYEDNATFSFVLDNEIKRYTVCAVYTASIYDNQDIAILINATMSDENITHIKSVTHYDTGVDMGEADKYMVLVTCKQHEPEKREIVVGKLTEEIVYG